MSRETVNVCQSVTNVESVVYHAHIVQGQPQKKGVSLAVVRQHQLLKYVNNVSRVVQLCSVTCPNCCKRSACSGQTESVWGNFGSIWGWTKGHTNVERGPHPRFPNQTKPNMVNNHHLCYVHPLRNLCLFEALHQLTNKNAVELVKNQESLLQPTVLVPKPSNKWRYKLDLSNLNKFLKADKFKMKTPETIRASLQTGERLSIDFKDAYFDIPIQIQSRIYLRFHIQDQTYQFKALPFGLFTAHYSEQRGQTDRFTDGHKDQPVPRRWLVQARSHQTCLQHT